MTDSTRIASNPTLGSATSGPSFPSPPTTTAPPLHSVLSDPVSSGQRSADQNWASVWGTDSATRTQPRDADAGVGLEPVPPRVRSSTQPQTANNKSEADLWSWSDPPSTSSSSTPPLADGRYSQSAAAAPAPQSNPAADAWANFGPSSNSASGGVAADQYAQPAQAPGPVRPVDQTAAQPVAGSLPTIGVAPTGNQQPQQARAASADELPWKPLLAVSLALAASLGANFFLGVSYADARHRYLSLVAKTTHAFQKEAGIAA
jgi:hypothetical protein